MCTSNQRFGTAIKTNKRIRTSELYIIYIYIWNKVKTSNYI